MATRSKKRKPIRTGTPAKSARASVAHPSRNHASGIFLFGDWKLILQTAVIVLAAFWVFWPVRHGQWIGDDVDYITANPLLNDPARLWKAWFQPGSFVEYYPLEQTVQWVQWQLWQNDTLGYHLTNIILHVTSALLVWRLFSKLGLRLAWLGGLIFTVHPMVVDSVALVNELKTVLSMPPFLLAMCFYLDYERRGHRRDYWLAVGLLAVAMLCKITMAMFPVVILLFAWWKRNRIAWSDLAASAPFFAISLALGLTTLWAGDSYRHLHLLNPAANPNVLGGFSYRLVLVGQILSFYFSRCFLPLTPLPAYPQWTVDSTAPLQFLPWLILGGTFYFLWTKRETWGRHALFCLGFFVIMLAPFLGANWISYMIVTWILEHLLYIPMLGLIGVVIAGLEQVDEKLPQACRPYGIGILAGAIALLAFQSRAYADKYINEGTLCTYTLEHYPENWMARNNLGLFLFQQGKVDEAIGQYQQALETKPGYSSALNNLGNALLQKKQLDAAIQQYQKALQINPNYAKAHSNLGTAFAKKGQPNEAIVQYQKAVELDPDLAETHYDLGVMFEQTGQLADAIAEYQKAVDLNPNFAQAHNDLAKAQATAGQKPGH